MDGDGRGELRGGAATTAESYPDPTPLPGIAPYMALEEEEERARRGYYLTSAS